jgi:NAD(P)-dependent dehydrogenase (short-subunit alcohol dehydrogenase family)
VHILVQVPVPAAATPTRRLIIVTGASRGIGFEVVRKLCERHDVSVVAAARAPAAARRDLDAAGCGAAVVMPLDVTDARSRAEFCDAIRAACAEGDTLYALVNNAAVMSDAWNEDVLRTTLATNLEGCLAMTEALAPVMSAGSRIVNVSSELGKLKSLSEHYRRAVQGAATCDALLGLKFAPAERGGSFTAYCISKVLLLLAVVVVLLLLLLLLLPFTLASSVRCARRMFTDAPWWAAGSGQSRDAAAGIRFGVPRHYRELRVSGVVLNEAGWCERDPATFCRCGLRHCSHRRRGGHDWDILFRGACVCVVCHSWLVPRVAPRARRFVVRGVTVVVRRPYVCACRAEE